MKGRLACVRLEDEPAKIIRRHLAEPAHSWSVGTYGAIGEFQYDADEPGLAVDLATLAVTTRRGALSVVTLDGVQPIALVDETGRTREIAFCTPQPGAQRSAIASLGGNLFDLGIAAPHLDMLVRLRADDVETAKALRASIGLG